ncbi:MAG: DUF222 domain-containing protein [Acidimicrobiia bacterium]|nr:DUF222 domain-containing protein [Acidimicrobiia bacterium]
MFRVLGTVIDKLREANDELHAAARALEAEDLDWLDHREQLLALERERERFEHTVGLLVSDCEARGASARDSAKSMADWLATHTGQRRAVTGSRVWLAVRLRSMPATDAAMAAGDITGSHATVLTNAQNPRTAEAFARDEAMLVDTARTVTADQLVRVVAHWLHHVDTDGPEPHTPDNDEFHLSELPDGRLKGDFTLSGDAAIRAKAIIDEMVRQLLHRDKQARTTDPSDGPRRRAPRPPTCPSPVRATRTSLGVAEQPGTAPTTVQHPHHHRNPHRNRRPHRLAHRGRPRLARRHPPQRPRPLGLRRPPRTDHPRRKRPPLDVGRSQRLATNDQRRALIARYGGCAVPGCAAPACQVEIHHITYWDDNGPTDLDNLLPQCSWHHHRLHDNSLHLHMHDGEPVFTLPDKRILIDPRAGPKATAA